MLHYMRSLLPGHPDNPLFEAIFIDLLPASARNAAVKHELLEDMAVAADKVLAQTPTSSPLAAAVSCDADHLPDGLDLAQVHQRSSTRHSPAKDPTLCFIHNRYGKNAYKCASPKFCKMKDMVVKPDSSAPGNARAGRQ